MNGVLFLSNFVFFTWGLICMYVYMHVCMFVCMYVCMHSTYNLLEVSRKFNQILNRRGIVFINHITIIVYEGIQLFTFRVCFP